MTDLSLHLPFGLLASRLLKAKSSKRETMMAITQDPRLARTPRQPTWQALPRIHTLARGVKRRRLLPRSFEQESEAPTGDPPGAGGSLTEPPALRLS